jgi:hypothetical protein
VQVTPVELASTRRTIVRSATGTVAESATFFAPAPTGPVADELSRYDTQMSKAQGLKK